MGETHVEKKEEIVEVEKHKHSQERIAGMRKKVDLTDIILEKEKKTANKKKSLLLALASFVLIFLIFLILSKIFNTDSNEQISQENNTSNNQIVLNKSTNPESETKQQTVQTNDKKELSDTDLKFEEMVKKLREEDAKENKTQIVQEQVEQPKQQSTANIQNKPQVKDIVTPAIKTTKHEVQKVKQEIKQLTSPITITEVKQKPKKIIKHSPSIRKPTRGEFISDATGYFVQVGATTSPEPNRALVSKIKANGYSYQTHPIVVKGRKFYKVLVGPYTTKAEAKAQLGNIRATINPKAFLYHLR